MMKWSNFTIITVTKTFFNSIKRAYLASQFAHDATWWQDTDILFLPLFSTLDHRTGRSIRIFNGFSMGFYGGQSERRVPKPIDQ